MRTQTLVQLTDDLVDDYLRLRRPRLADGHLQLAELLATVERELRGRHGYVDPAFFLGAARIGEYADDLERDAADGDPLSDRWRTLEQKLRDGLADHGGLAIGGDVTFAQEAALSHRV